MLNTILVLVFATVLPLTAQKFSTGDNKLVKEESESTAFLWPARAEISFRYGRKSDPFNGKPYFHTGIDLKGRIGESVKSSADGVVKDMFMEVPENKGDTRGNYIVIEHTNGYSTKYFHLDEVIVEKNQKINAGDVIGTVGSSGRSTGPHLHFELLKNGKHINPLEFLR